MLIWEYVGGMFHYFEEDLAKGQLFFEGGDLWSEDRQDANAPMEEVSMQSTMPLRTQEVGTSGGLPHSPEN